MTGKGARTLLLLLGLPLPLLLTRKSESRSRPTEPIAWSSLTDPRGLQVRKCR